MNDVAIAVRGVTRSFGTYTALSDVTLEVKNGEFLSLVGPSGCGKSTLLRILGGFDRPNQGTVYLSGQEVTDLPPEQRSTNMVFQKGALFPHMTVAENIGYPLKRKKVAAQAIERRVNEMLDLIRLAGFGHRKPAELSGGQAQRVALARALIGRPDVLLLDEPFSALDLSLRKELQLELKRIHREFACAFVFVTHDQEEALVLSDRIAIMNRGKILQDADPISVYQRPTDIFAAQFIGEMNLLPASVEGFQDGWATVKIGKHRFQLAGTMSELNGADRVLVSVRPEHVCLEEQASGLLNAQVEEVIFVGSRLRIRVFCPDLEAFLWAETSATDQFQRMERGQATVLSLRTEYSRLLPAQ